MTRETQETAVQLAGVTKTYQTGAVEVAALRGISLQIPIRSFAMVVGPSGSGKTTLLNLVGCIDAPSTWSVTACGQRIGELNDNALADFRARTIGFVFQNFNLVPVLSAYENVEQPLFETEPVWAAAEVLDVRAVDRLVLRTRTCAMQISQWGWSVNSPTSDDQGALISTGHANERHAERCARFGGSNPAIKHCNAHHC